MHGVTTRLPRVAHEIIKYKEWEIPPNVSLPLYAHYSPLGYRTYPVYQTPISQCNYFVHMDPAIFPEPFDFLPERWIEAKEKGDRLDKYMVSFSRGSRQCVGIKYVSPVRSDLTDN